jgi:hypothetical protein
MARRRGPGCFYFTLKFETIKNETRPPPSTCTFGLSFARGLFRHNAAKNSNKHG